MSQADVDGALVGGASLDPEEFAKIVRTSRTRLVSDRRFDRGSVRCAGRTRGTFTRAGSADRDVVAYPCPGATMAEQVRDRRRPRTRDRSMSALRIALEILLVVTSFLVVVLVLLHKGKGGGLSDMFGGGISSGAGTSGVAERNLNRITVGLVLVWTAIVVLLGLIQRVS